MGSLASRLNAVFDPAIHSQAELARRCGVKPSSVADWFSGESKTIKSVPLLRASAYLHVNPLWLAAEEGPCRPDDWLAAGKSDHLATGSGPRKRGQSTLAEGDQAALSQRAMSIAERLDALSDNRRQRAYALMDLTLSTIEAEEAATHGSASAKRRSRKA